MGSQSLQSFDVIVLGGGAAGLMCAIEAGKRGRSVFVLERSEKIGKKILISGGGRCNFTNLHCRPGNFISENPHFAKSALARYQPADFIQLVEKHGIRYHEKTLGQLFCDGSAREIVAMLEAECAAAGVEIVTNAHVDKVEHLNGFTLQAMLDGSRCEFTARALVIATGGLSIPKMGATSFGYDLAQKFDLKIADCRPALVPLTFKASDLDRWSGLTGVSTEVIATTAGKSAGKKAGKSVTPEFREKMLFTHRGLSGPAILQVSSYWHKGNAVVLDLAPRQKLTAEMRQHAAGRNITALKAAFRSVMPHRLADRWIDVYPPEDFTNRGLDGLEQLAHQWSITPDGTEGYEKAEVTAGGVSTDELDARTMECKKVKGLFFIGEVVDVTGHLGGFNFQWAWASGFSAGQTV